MDFAQADTTLEDREYKVTIAAYRAKQQALFRFGNMAIKPLVKALDHRYQNVRNWAAQTLQKLNWQPESADERGLFALYLGNWDDAAHEGGESGNVRNKVRAAEALGESGNSAGVLWLIASTTNELEAGFVIQALTRILQANAKSVSSDYLETISGLDKVTQKYTVNLGRNWNTDKYEWADKHKEIDCSQLRQLAEQELTRRRLEV